ncbi:MAG: GNAT family N-acetyltransferase [Kiritimatiellales bacterium]
MLCDVMFTEVTTPKRIDTVAHLARKVWMEHYVPIIGEEQTEYMLKKFQSPEAIAGQIQSGNYLYFLIEPEKHPVGYLAVQPQKEYLFLSKIYLEHALRGMGVGHKAIRFVEDLAKKLKKTVITLTVNRNNSDSIAAYSRWGFRIVDKVITDIGSGFVMDDYVMQKQLSEEN